MELVMAMNPLFFLATAAFGWGLSLATYRMVATHNSWPMGDLQAQHPLFVALIGIVALVTAFLFAAVQGQNGPLTVGWSIIGLGLLFALFWTGFLRVASQTALFLAPLATFLLVLGWASSEDMPGDVKSVLSEMKSDMKGIGEKLKQSERNLEAAVADRLQKRREQGAPNLADPTTPAKPYQPQ
jgi:hypothetical protein